jgi:anaerobic selenocysteine-containing dehydrogenase
MSEKISRRKLLKNAAAGTLAIAGFSVLSNISYAAKDPCTDTSGLDQKEIDKRNKTFKYVEKSKKDGQTCSNCQLVKPKDKDTGCHGCMLFKGPVTESGWCLSWVKKSG